MKEAILAERYLNAFLNCFDESKQLSALEQLKSFLKVINEDEAVTAALFNPTITFTQKESLLKTLLDSAENYVGNFVLLLLKKKRFSLFVQVFNIIDQKILDIKKLVLLNVYSSNRLSPDQTKQIENFGKAYFEKDVEIIQHIDESILAGFRIETVDVKFDATLRNSLEELALAFNN